MISFQTLNIKLQVEQSGVAVLSIKPKGTQRNCYVINTITILLSMQRYLLFKTIIFWQ